jgi:HEAT repeat protein
VRERYEVVARYGRYDVMARRPVAVEAERPLEAGTPDRPAEPDWLFAALADPDRDTRRAATQAFLAEAGDAAGVPALATAWAPDDARRLLLLRNLGESGDARGLGLLVDVFEHATLRPSAEAASALTLVAMRARADRYLFGRTEDDAIPGFGDGAPALVQARMLAWLEDPKQRRKVGVVAARALAGAGDVAAVPALEQVLRDEKRIGLRVAAAEALVRLGRLEHLDELVGVLGVQKHEVQDVVPSTLLEVGRVHPAEVGAALGRMMIEGNPLARETSAWVAGALPAAAAGPALRRALEDRAVGVRIAAAWAVGRLRDAPAREALVRLADHPDPELREFVREALSRLGAVS